MLYRLVVVIGLIQLFALLSVHAGAGDAGVRSLEEQFAEPDHHLRPETWFHLIGGNVSSEGLTVDLESVASAGLSGIQLFHGRGRDWPGVSPQIQTLSPEWDGMIRHVAEETERLDLKFTMQNCPGWAMSGGPWITPDRAMRHLVWNRLDVQGGARESLELPMPFSTEESWRDYREIAVVAFPTPLGDTGEFVSPTAWQSNQPELDWESLLSGTLEVDIELAVGEEPVWLEINFDEALTLRSIELPPVEYLAKRRIFDPQVSIRVQALGEGGFVDIYDKQVPRSTWQDKDWDERPYVLALSEQPSKTYRILFENTKPAALRYLRFSTAARMQDWHGQAAYVLRKVDFGERAKQDAKAWVSYDSVLDLSDSYRNGKLDWDTPAGRWTILRIGNVNTGVKNKPAPPEATGFECDKLSPLGAEQHFAGYIGRLTDPGGPAAGKLEGMLIDSWECFTQTWTPKMEEEFKTRRGYALRRYFPALAGWVVDDVETTQRFYRDWRSTISDLLVNNYFGRLAELARERGLTLSYEMAMGDVAVGDILEYYGRADIPMAEFWQPNDPHWGGLEQKPTSPVVSAAHIYGKKRVAAEAFTSVLLNWAEHPYMLKHQADKHFALGINHLVFHTYTHNPRLDLVPGTSFGSRIGSPFVRGQTWWQHMPLFTDYLARCHSMLQQGKSKVDILWYLGDAVDHKPRQDAAFPEGFDFDYLNADVLANRVSVRDGKLTIPEGNTWELIWFREENNCRLTVDTLRHLKRLLEAGAKVVASPPLENASLSGGEKHQALFDSLVADLWGGASPPQGDRTVGKGRLLWGMELDEALALLELEPDVLGASAATWCHREVDSKDIYFIAAGRESPLQANLDFRATGRVSFWDPLTGETEEAALYSQSADRTVLPIDLPVAGSVFVVFEGDESEAMATRIEKDGTILFDAMDRSLVDQGRPDSIQGLVPGEEVQPWVDSPLAVLELEESGTYVAWENGNYEAFNRDVAVGPIQKVSNASVHPLNGSWELRFPEGWDTQKAISMPTVKAWTELDHPESRAFSGTAKYVTRFHLGALDENQVAMLDLGRADNIVSLSVNGTKAQTLWAPPFRFSIADLLQEGENRIEVSVTNTWHNRLVYDGGLPEEERKTWTIHAPKPENDLIRAGLSGPVLLRFGERISFETQ